MSSMLLLLFTFRSMSTIVPAICKRKSTQKEKLRQHLQEETFHTIHSKQLYVYMYVRVCTQSNSVIQPSSTVANKYSQHLFWSGK